MKTTLKEIVSGHHNDANCKTYQNKYKRIHGKAPQSCKYIKDNLKNTFRRALDINTYSPDIQKLLDKIVVIENGKVVKQ